MATSAQITFDSKDLKDALKKLEKRWKSIASRQEFGGIISATVFQDIMDHFAKEEGPEGAWADWSKTYAEHLKRIGRGGNKKLQFSGRMRQSFMPSSWRGTTDGILFFNKAQTKGGFPYAQAHDEGGSKKNRPPARPFMWLSDKAMGNVIERTLAWLKEDVD